MRYNRRHKKISRQENAHADHHPGIRVPLRGRCAELYEANGWTAYTACAGALRDSLLALGDGETVVLLQDLFVHPHFQGRSVGTLLLAELSRRFAHVRQMHLFCDAYPALLAFYRKNGFVPAQEMGLGGLMRR